MKLFGRFVASLPTTLRQAAAVLGAAVLLSACGGGEQSSTFQPARILVFGDENSMLTSSGQRYGVNGLKTDGTLDCTLNPIWVQRLATSYGLVFPECNPNAVASPTSRILAEVSADISAVTAQIDRQFATGGGFGSSDLVVIMAGGYDVLNQYAQYPTVGETAAKAALKAKGDDLAKQVARIIATGAKVLLATALDQGLTPYALAQKAANTDRDRAALLTAYSEELKTGLRVGLPADSGKNISLMLADERISVSVKFPGSYGFANVVDPACQTSAVLPNCTTQTLVTNSSGATIDPAGYMWADGTRMAPGAHNRLGELAENNARRNPF